MTDDHGQEPDDAAEADPVRQYYDDKKKRYMQKMREATKDMNTGTPFDWEDAERYAEEGEHRHSRVERDKGTNDKGKKDKSD